MVTRLVLARFVRPVALLALLGLAGCPSLSQLNTATPVGSGNIEIVAQPMAVGFPNYDIDNDGRKDFGNSDYLWFPMVDFGARFGASDDIDIGVSLRGFWNWGFNVNVNIINTDVLALSINPALNIGAIFLFNPELPLLVDIKLGDTFRINLGAKYSPWIFFTGDVAHFLGGSAGVEILLGDMFVLGPNVAVLGLLNPGPGELPVFISIGLNVKLLID